MGERPLRHADSIRSRRRKDAEIGGAQPLGHGATQGDVVVHQRRGRGFDGEDGGKSAAHARPPLAVGTPVQQAACDFALLIIAVHGRIALCPDRPARGPAEACGEGPETPHVPVKLLANQA